MDTLDNIDHKILRELQRDAAISLEDMGTRVGLSRNACWKRVRTMEQSGVIRGRVALVDAAKLGLALEVFILIRTSSHTADWLATFSRAVRQLPEIQGAYRMSGDLDYMIRARVRDISDYDDLYRRLIEMVPLSDVSASFVMEAIKDTTEVMI